ncbi:MAG: hypothetical protein DRP11_04640 [Candidatus Aenigmatarchaeota archaeon]|nr:MAG: hypothetical protein DRP11_04640 [Candidatus Aenigmarchaeota archaeon]
MAYSRWSFSDWYVFWHTSNARRKEDELLAVWHVGVDEDSLPVYRYMDVVAMLTANDLSRIPGYKPEDHDFLVGIFKKWVADVDKWYEQERDS